MPENNVDDARRGDMLSLQKRLETELQDFRQGNALFWGAYIDETVFQLLHKRMSSLGVRSYFLFKVAQYIQAMAEKEGCTLRACPDPNLFRTTIPFLAETIIAVQYYHNQVLDGKGGVNTSEAINNTLLSGNLLRAFTERYIRSRVIDPVVAEHLLRCTSKIFELVDVAQWMDKHWGNEKAFLLGKDIEGRLSDELEQFCIAAPIAKIWEILHDNGIKPGYQSFTELYLKRCFLANSSLFMILSKCVIDLLGYEGSEQAKVLNFAAEYGVLSQLVNDTNDLLPHKTIDKQPEDVFADLKNGTVTLPYILYLSFNPDVSIPALQEHLRNNKDSLFELFLPMIVNVCIPLVRKFAQELGSDLDPTEGRLFINMRTLGTVNTHFKEYNLKFRQLPQKKQQ